MAFYSVLDCLLDKPKYQDALRKDELLVAFAKHGLVHISIPLDPVSSVVIKFKFLTLHNITPYIESNKMATN